MMTTPVAPPIWAATTTVRPTSHESIHGVVWKHLRYVESLSALKARGVLVLAIFLLPFPTAASMHG